MYCYRHPGRETRVSCSECGRPHLHRLHGLRAGRDPLPGARRTRAGASRVTSGVKRAAYEGTGALVTKVADRDQRARVPDQPRPGIEPRPDLGLPVREGRAVRELAVLPGGLADGEWYRLITAAFLHGNLIHLGLNMFVLWIVGAPVEQAIGRGRFLALYIVSGLAGSAGAIIFSPTRSPSAPRARSSGSSAPRSSSRGSGTTCSADRRSG